MTREVGRHSNLRAEKLSGTLVWHPFSFSHHEDEKCSMPNISNGHTDNAYIKG